MIKKLILGFAFAFFFILPLSTPDAQACTLSSTPSQPVDGSPAGDLSTSFQVFASECVDGNYYIALELNGTEFSNQEVQISGGVLQNTFRFTSAGPGTVTVILHQFLSPIATLSLEIADASAPGSYSCGDLVPLSVDGDAPDPSACPVTTSSTCPLSDRGQDTGSAPWHCQCGALNTSPCPAGNSMGFPEGCANAALVIINNLCQNVDSVTHTAALLVGQGCGNELGYVNTAIGCIPFDAVQETAKFFLQWGLSVGGGIALFLIGVAGFMFATSSGDPKKLENSKSMLFSAISGLLMIVLSVFLLRFIGVNILGLFS